MNNYVRKHNYGYGINAEKEYDSKICKLELRNLSDLKCYLKEFLQSQLLEAKVINNNIITSYLPDIKIQIKSLDNTPDF